MKCEANTFFVPSLMVIKDATSLFQEEFSQLPWTKVFNLDGKIVSEGLIMTTLLFIGTCCTGMPAFPQQFNKLTSKNTS